MDNKTSGNVSSNLVSSLLSIKLYSTKRNENLNRYSRFHCERTVFTNTYLHVRQCDLTLEWTLNNIVSKWGNLYFFEPQHRLLHTEDIHNRQCPSIMPHKVPLSKMWVFYSIGGHLHES